MNKKSVCGLCEYFVDEITCRFGYKINENNNCNAYEKMKPIYKEIVNHPKHYNMGKIEAIDVIEDWKLDFNLGSTIKYIARAGYKDDIIQDLKKAAWYVNREIEYLEKNKGGITNENN